METKQVVCAVIRRGERIFATQRGYGEFKDGWEFPGGKVEPGETPQQAIAREIQEELNTRVEVMRELGSVETDYPTFHLSMKCFLCQVQEGNLELLEHEAAKWLTRENLRSVAWLPADRYLVDTYEEEMFC